MDIGLENRLDRVLISLVLERKGRSDLRKIRAIALWEDQGDRTSLDPKLL